MLGQRNCTCGEKRRNLSILPYESQLLEKRFNNSPQANSWNEGDFS